MSDNKSELQKNHEQIQSNPMHILQQEIINSGLSVNDFIAMKLGIPTFEQAIEFHKYIKKKKSNFFVHNFEYFIGFPVSLLINFYIFSRIEWYLCFMPGIITAIGCFTVGRWIKEIIFIDNRPY